MHFLLRCAVFFSFGLVVSAALASPYPLSNILEKDLAAKFAKEKINTSNDLFERGITVKDRRALAKSTTIALDKITELVNMCSLLRIKGVGPEMVKLLKAAKVKTVSQLRLEKAPALFQRVMAANNKEKITEKPPAESQLQNWIEQAKKLPTVEK